MIDPEKIKADSGTLLREWGFAVNDHLPTLESEEELSPPSAADVARRCMVLSYVIGIGFGGDANKLRAALEQFNLWPHASERERELLGRTEHSEQERINATWLTECMQSLAWCLSLDEMPRLQNCHEDLASKFPAPYTDPSAFISSAVLRSFEEIYREADLHYRLHWAVVNSRLSGQELRLNEGLIRERRKALDWVLGVEADWDEVPADT